MTNTQWLQERMRERAGFGVHFKATITEQQARARAAHFFGPGGVLETLARLAHDRKLTGSYRYEQKGSDGLSYDDKANLGLERTYLERLIGKVVTYRDTKNLEFMVDVFNYVLLEWDKPSIPGAFFESTEREG